MRGAVLRGRTSVLALGFVLAAAGVARAENIVLPNGGQVVAGSAVIGTGASQVTVDQTSSHAIVDWRSFSVGAGGTVAFNNGSGATLNRVTGGDMSSITGQLTATGSVYLINPAGIVIDSGGRVLTGGSFVASTRMMDAASFLSGGDATFSGTSAGGIENRGSITSGGDVVLIGKMVVNSGSINADGTAGLVAADHIVLRAPSTHQRITVDYGDGDVTNSGVIAAATAELRAASGNVFALAGNNGGIISVVGNATQAGRIWLGAGGNVSLSGSLLAKNADGSGGTVHVLGTDIALASGSLIDVSGTSGGTALIGGDYLGGNGDRHFAYETLTTAANLSFASGATVRADALSTGDGGNIVLWSEQSTQAYGAISARGGTLSGNGGFVETSSHNLLSFGAAVDTRAVNGMTGTLLLDPSDITINNTADSNFTGNPTFTGGTNGAASVITVTTLLAALNTSNVIVQSGATGTGTGNITVASALVLTSGFNLTFNAFGAFNNTAGITLAGGNLNITADTGITITGAITKESGAASQLNLTNTGLTSDITINQSIIAANTNVSNISLALTATSARDILFSVSPGRLAVGLTSGGNLNTLTATLNARDISFNGALSTLVAGVSGATRSTLTVNANATRDITLNKTITAAAPTVNDSATANVVNANFFATGAINQTGTSGITASSNGTGLSQINVDWRAGTTITTGATSAFATLGGTVSLRTLTTSPVTPFGATAGGTITVGSGIDTNGGDLTLNAAGTGVALAVNALLRVALTGGTGGNLTATSAGSVTFANAATITGSSVAANARTLSITATNGDLTLGTGVVTGNGASFNLTSSATGTGTITTGGAINTSAGNVVYTSNRTTGSAIATTGTITTASGAEIRLTAAADIAIGATTNSSGGTGRTLISSGGTVTQTAAVLTGQGLILNGVGTFNLTLDANNSPLLAGNAGAINYRQGANSIVIGSVTVNGATTNGITTTGALRLGTNTAGSVTQSGGSNITVGTAMAPGALLINSFGTITLANAGNSLFGDLALANTNAPISFTSTGNINIGSVTGVGNIVATSGITSGSGLITLSGTGTITQTEGSNITHTTGGGLLLLGTGGVYTLTSTGNDIITLAANTGRVAYTDSNTFTTGSLGGTNGITTSATSSGRTDFTVDLQTRGTNLLTVGAVNSNISTGGNGNVRLVADRMAISGTINVSAAAGRIVRMETTTAARGIDFGGAGADGDDAATLKLDTSELGRITADITHIGSATAGQLTVLSNFNATNSDNLSLETGAGVNQTAGSISVMTGLGNLAIRGVGDIDLGTQNNQVAKVAISSAGGNVRFRDDNGFVIDTVDGITTSVVSPGGLLQLVTGVAGTVSQAHALTADNLRLGSAAALTGTYTLSNAANNFTTVAGRAASLTLTETGGFAVGTVDTLAGLTATTAATLASTGAVTQSQIITTPLLTLNGTGGAFTLTGNNQVTALTGNTGSIDFQNTLAAGLTINDTTVATTAKITSNAAGNLVIGTNQTIASSATTGDSVILGTNANFVANTGAAINPGTGTARYLVFTNNVGNATEWTGTVRGSLTGGNFYNAAFDVAAARSAAVGSPNLVSTVTGNRFVYADQPTLLYTIMAADTKTYTGLIQNLPSSFTSGLVNSDLIGASATGAAGSTGQAANVGVYNTVTGTLGSLASPLNYAFSFTGTGIQTITPALLTINVADKAKIYGDADPAFTFTVTGLQNGEAVGTALNTAGTTYTANGAGGTNLTNALTRNGDNNVGGTKVITTGAGLTATSNYTIQTINPGALTISKRDTTIVAVAKTKVYGDADPALTFTLGSLQAGDTAAGVVTGALTRVAGETVIGAGPTYQINQGTLALNGNYNLTTYTPANLTITPAPLAISGSGTKAFGQADPVLTITSNGYKLADTQGTVLTGALTRTAGESVAGSPYTVNQGTVVANGNYAVTYTPGQFTITQATLNLTYSVANTANVYGTLPTVGAVTLTGIINGNIVTPVITVTNALAAPVVLATTTGVGIYTAAVTSLAGADAGNYTIAGAGNTNGTITVSAAPLVVNVASFAKVYGDADPAFTFTVTGIQNGEAVGVALNTAGTTYTANGAGGTNLTTALTRNGDNNVGGTKVITTGAGLTATSNYTIQTINPGALTITKRDTSIVAVAKTKVYGDADPALTFTLGNLAAGDTATGVTTGALTRLAGETVAAGPYAIGQGTVALNGNYNLTTYTPANLTITAAPLTVTVSAATKVYGQTDPALGFTAAGFKLTDTQGAVLTGALARAAGETVAGGPYAINQGTLAANTNYAVMFTGNNLAITAAPLTITVADKTKIYGDADPALTFTVAGIQNGEAVGTALNTAGTSYTANGAGGTNITTALTRSGDNNVGGTKTITTGAGLTATSNYAITTVVNGNLTITKRDTVLSAVAKTKIYGDADPALTFTVGNLAAGDTATGIATGALTRVAGENVVTSPYQINQGTLALNGNYNVTAYNPANLTITPAPLTVTAVAATKVYGQVDPAIGFLSAGYKFADTPTGVLTGNVGRTAGVNVGTYPINQGTVASNPNYAISFVPANLSITPATVVVTGTGNKIFGQPDPVLTPVSTGLVNGDTQAAVLTGALTRNPGESAGMFTINQGTIAANSNYNLVYVPGVFTINPAGISFTINYSVANSTSVYGTLPAAGAVTLTGVVGNDIVTPVITVTNAQNAAVVLATTTGVGAYTATVTALGGANAGNYILAGVGNTNGTITVTPAPLVLTLANKTKVYGDADPALTFTVAGIQNGEAVGTALTGAGTLYTANGAGGTNATTALSRVAGENVATGPYAISKGAGVAATANYTIQTVVPGALTITPAPLAVTGSATKVYGQPDPVLTVTSTGYKLTDTPGTVLTGVLARTPGTNVGTYAITQGSLLANPNYLVTYTPGALAITPATLTYAVGNTTNVYGILPTIGTTVLTGIVTGDTVNPAHTVTNAQNGVVTLAINTNVGTYGAAVTSLTGASAGNYVLATTGNTNGTITVTPATLTITPVAGTKVYGSPDPTLPFTATGIVGGDPATVLTGLLGRAPGENAGPYNFTNGTLTAGPNYVLALTPPGPVFTVTPKPITYAVGNTTNVYGILPTIGTTVLTGVLAGDTVNPAHRVTNSLAAAVTLATNTGVGVYGAAVNALTGASAGNYSLAASGNTNGTITVTPATLTITPLAGTKVYGSPDPVLAFATAGLVGGDTGTVLTGLLGRGAGENVGPYNFTNGTLTAGPNYVLALTPPGPVFTVTPKPVTFAVANTTSVYGTLGARGAITLTGVLAGDTVTGVYAPVTSAQSANVTLATTTPAGPYGVTVASITGASSSNYMLAAAGNTPGVLTVTRAPLTLAIGSFSRVFGFANPTLTFAAAGFVAGDTAAALISLNPADAGANRLAVSTIAGQGSPAGNYPIVSSGALVNYAVTVTPGVATVTGMIMPEPPVAPGTSGGSISPTGLNYAGGSATISAIVADPGAPAAEADTGGLVTRREDSNKAFNIYIEVVPEAAQQSGPAFGGLGTAEVQGGNNGPADIVSTSSFDPPVANDNDEDIRRRTPSQPGAGR